MRVLITTDTIGGVWTFTKELTQDLLEYGFSVALVSLGREPERDQQDWADRIAAGSWGRFQFHALTSPLEWMQDNAAALTQAAPFLERLAETFKADLIHANQFCFGALATRVPVLITAHSDVLSWAEACNPEALADSAWLTRYRSLVQHGLYAAAGVAAPTRWMLDALRANFHLPPLTAILANGRTLDSSGAPGLDSETWVSSDLQRMGIDAEPLTGITATVLHQPSQRPSTSRKLQAVTAGRLWDQAKNLRLLTEITSPIPLVIAGEAPPDATPNITFAGQLPEQALLNLFRETAIYICPSIYEPFGLAPLEAALCGCAVLANDLPSLRQVWGEAALYFTDGPSLERCLTHLAANPDQLDAAQQRSFARAQGFSRGRMAAGYVRLYREILNAQEAAHAA